MDPTADIKIGLDRHPPGPRRLREIIEDLVRDRFMKGTLIAVTPEIKLQALELDAEFIGDVGNADHCEIRLPGLRTEAGKLRAFQVDLILAARLGVPEYLETLRRL